MADEHDAAKCTALVTALRREIEALEKRTLDRFAGVTRETDLARTTIDQRLHGMNELREELRFVQATFATREAMDRHLAVSDGMRQQIAVNTERLARIEADIKASLSDGTGTIFRRLTALEALSNRWWGAVLALSAIAGSVGAIISRVLHP